MLVLTTACNLDCVYCYEGGGNEKGETMALETALRALDLVAASNQPFHVQLTGGEPLLAGELVFSILEYIRNNNLPATTAIQTNGVLLDCQSARRACTRLARLWVSASMGCLPCRRGSVAGARGRGGRSRCSTGSGFRFR